MITFLKRALKASVLRQCDGQTNNDVFSRFIASSAKNVRHNKNDY